MHLLPDHRQYTEDTVLTDLTVHAIGLDFAYSKEATSLYINTLYILNPLKRKL
uniref:Uncharacterized protein n=1 Tax=Anguilla anguilla TaxID=7936 RepID=A0A0E9WLT7_ANGAN